MHDMHDNESKNRQDLSISDMPTSKPDPIQPIADPFDRAINDMLNRMNINPSAPTAGSDGTDKSLIPFGVTIAVQPDLDRKSGPKTYLHWLDDGPFGFDMRFSMTRLPTKSDSASTDQEFQEYAEPMSPRITPVFFKVSDTKYFLASISVSLVLYASTWDDAWKFAHNRVADLKINSVFEQLMGACSRGEFNDIFRTASEAMKETGAAVATFDFSRNPDGSLRSERITPLDAMLEDDDDDDSDDDPRDYRDM